MSARSKRNFWFFWGGAIAPSYTATITPPGGTIYQFVDVTFTVSTDVPSPTYTWSVSGGSVISGQGTTSAVIRFTSSGSCSVTCTIGGGGSASDTEPVTVTAFTPAAIANLAGWWDASSLSYLTLDGSNQATDLTDRSGNTRTISQATSTLRPPWTASARNGLGAISLDAIDDWMGSSVITPGSWIGSGTAVTIMTFGQYTGGRFGLQLNTARTGSTSLIQLDMAFGWVFTNGGFSETVPTTAPTSGNYYCDIVRWASGERPTVRRYTSGSTTTTQSTNILTTTYATNLAAFIARSGTTALQGYQGEASIWSRKITDSEADSLIPYLISKWGSF